LGYPVSEAQRGGLLGRDGGATMTINFVNILVIVILAGLFWWANERVNTVPILKPIIQVVIVVGAVLALLYSFGWISGDGITVW
jgi:hypothetical protein